MAASSDTTRAPAPLPYVHRPAPPVDDPRTADELLDEIGREIDRQAEAERARPRGRVGRALASAWADIEADSEVWRGLLRTLYGSKPS